MFKQNENIFGYIPKATVKVPLSQPLAALVLHMVKHRFGGGITISVEDIEERGAQLVLSTLIDNTWDEKGHKDLLAIIEEDDKKHLKELINDMIEEKFAEDDERLLEHFNQLNEEDDEEDWEDEEELAF
ncbi:hypothetical protein IZY60_12700 [Lutibacter sp. B2]|nr:hypothetical protein [Lutibacter sp. B2]